MPFVAKKVAGVNRIAPPIPVAIRPEIINIVLSTFEFFMFPLCINYFGNYSSCKLND